MGQKRSNVAFGGIATLSPQRGLYKIIAIPGTSEVWFCSSTGQSMICFDEKFNEPAMAGASVKNFSGFRRRDETNVAHLFIRRRSSVAERGTHKP